MAHKKTFFSSSLQTATVVFIQQGKERLHYCRALCSQV